MKATPLLLLIALLSLSLPLQAAEMALTFEAGTGTGSLNYESSASGRQIYNEKWDHDLSGKARAVVIHIVDESSFIYGLGNHSYAISGKGTTEETDSVGLSTYETRNYTVAGNFFLLGYQWEAWGFLRFEPQLRIGYNNRAYVQGDSELSETGTGINEDRFTHESDATVVVVSLPLNFKMGGFFFGVQYQAISAGLEISKDDAKNNYSLTSAVMGQFGFLY